MPPHPSKCMDFQIVPYREEFQNQVGSLIVGIQSQEFQVPITLEDQPDLVAVDDFYRHGKGDFWVALKGGDVIGTIALRDIGNSQGALRKMFVDRDYRGSEKGVGLALLNHLMQAAKT